MFRFHLSRRRPLAARPRRRPLQVEALEARCVLDRSYNFQPLAFLGDPVPGGGGYEFTFDFEPGEINNRGQVVFGADLTIGGEGVFLAEKGQLAAIARTGDPTPDDPDRLFGPLFLGTITNNDAGEAVVSFHRDGFTFPALLGVDSGLYRYSSVSQALTPLLLPGAPAPGGGTFHGYNFRPSLNNAGTLAFSGLIETDIGPGNPEGGPTTGLGFGIFTVDNQNRVRKVARPGDPAPGGKTFDFLQNPWINDGGDVAFGAHVAEDECITFAASYPTGNQIFCAESVYLWSRATGQIVSIAHQGEPAPGWDGNYVYAFGPSLNNRGQVAYIGALTVGPGDGRVPPGDNTSTGVFFYDGRRSVPVALPGDAMPGGGHLRSAGFFTGEISLNNEGTISFTATLDTDDNGDGLEDTGLYTWSRGKLSLVARTGTVLPGLGTIQSFHPPEALGFPTTFAGAANNDRGQIVTQVTLEGEGEVGVMLLATPQGKALLAAGQPGVRTADDLAGTDLGPLVLAASKGWEAAGRDVAPLASVQVQIADLPGNLLGLAGRDVIFLDRDAAGWGWFGGADPAAGPVPSGRMDLLTVLSHEMGHLLGLEHQDEGVMHETLSAGTRDLPTMGSALPTHPGAFLSWEVVSLAIAVDATELRKR